MRECGGCTMCCKLLGVEELSKDSHTWCQHCPTHKSCEIYASRPQSCRNFVCSWLEESLMPDELRPDCSKVVMCRPSEQPVEGYHVDYMVMEDIPGKSQQGMMGRVIQELRGRLGMTIFVVSSEASYILHPLTNGMAKVPEVQVKGSL